MMMMIMMEVVRRMRTRANEEGVGVNFDDGQDVDDSIEDDGDDDDNDSDGLVHLG